MCWQFSFRTNSVNDRVISANGRSLENVQYSEAIQVLRECGNTVNLLIKRPVSGNNSVAAMAAAAANNNGSGEPNNNLIKLSLRKAHKKDGQYRRNNGVSVFFLLSSNNGNVLFYLWPDFGIVLGCRIYVKEITNRVVLNEKDTSIQEGDIVYKVSECDVFMVDKSWTANHVLSLFPRSISVDQQHQHRELDAEGGAQAA